MTDIKEAPSGIILVDKKPGITSMATDNFIKKVFGTRKVGHSGTLDPFATGLLPIFTGKALRYMRYTDGYDKAYSCVVCFGAATDTMDKLGEVTGGREITAEELEKLRSCDYADIRTAFEQIAKQTEQVPPKYSAKKINGQKAYDLARRGEEVILPPVPIKIHSLVVNEIYEQDQKLFASFDVECSKGTYIRKICDDVGSITGYGAYAVELRRTKCGSFSVEDALTEEEIRSKAEAGDYSFVINGEQALSMMPSLQLNQKQFKDVKLGRKIRAIEGTEYEVKYASYFDGKLVAVLYKSSEEDGKEVMRIERMLYTDD